MNNPLVSVIIPTFNRAHLIAETLDCILAQTYTNWECIIVDDGSTDASEILIKKYCDKDDRFSYYQRPNDRHKGANTCRNFGLEKSNGTLINWFDSDDYMAPSFLEKKVAVLETGPYDFVMSTSVDWDGANKETPIYETRNAGKEISAYHFITQHINCITNDFMATRTSIGALRFNEALKSGQEYNFISRYLFSTTQGTFIHEVLSKRRVHPGSIQSSMNRKMEKDLIAYHQRTVENKVLLLKDIQAIGDDKSKEYLVHSIMNFSYQLALKKQSIPFFSEILKAIKTIKGPRNKRLFFIAMKTLKYSGKGYKLFKKSLV